MRARTLGTLPTEHTVTHVLDGDLSALWPALGWTVFRAGLIFPAVWFSGVEPKRALIAAALASTFLTISAYSYVASLPKEGSST